MPQLVLLFWRGQLRGMLSYFSIPEMRRTAVALTLAFGVQALLCRVALGPRAPRISLLLMDFLLSFLALCGVRMTVRLLREHSSKAAQSPERPWRVAIIGTGELATNLALDLGRSKSASCRIVAFFDDNPRTWRKRPHDIPVVGMPECLLNSEWQNKIDEVVLAMAEDDPARVREISEMLKCLPMKVTIASRWPLLRSVHS